MSRGLIRSLLLTVFAAWVLLGANRASASAAGGADSRFAAVLERFLSLDDPAPTAYRSLRHLEANQQRLNKAAWMDVWTESDELHGFKYTVVAQGGFGY